MVGYSERSGDDELFLTRHRRNGEPDPGFGDNGVVITTFGEPADVFGHGVAVQEDMRIVVAGEVSNSWIVARFEPGGSLDETFGDGGVRHSAPISAGTAHDVEILPDGSILAAGCERDGVGSEFGLARYSSVDGSPVTSFGENGAARISFGDGTPADCARGLGIQSNGRIVLAGTASPGADPRFALARFRPGGVLDRSFSGDGKAVTAFRPHPTRLSHSDYGQALAIDGQDKVTVAGFTDPSRQNDDFAVARYLGG